MGTDIHTAVEVRRNGRWHFAGRMFESRWDWSYEPCTREVLDSLSDGQLIDGLNYYLARHLGSRVRPGVLLTYEDFERREEVHRENVQAARNRSKSAGWDYERNVRPVELAGRRALYDGTRLDPVDRESLIVEVLAYLEERVAEEMRRGATREEAEEWGDLDIRIDLAEGDPPLKTREPFDCRCYDLFAALADVRNGEGFGGMDTGDPIRPIATPRGVPTDADPQTLKGLSGEHTPSWLTLQEIQSYDWDRPKTSRGVVTGELYEVMRSVGTTHPFDDEVVELCSAKGISGGYCGGVSGPRIRTFSEAGYAAWKEAGCPGLIHRDSPLGWRVIDSGEVARLEHRDDVEVKPYVKVAWTVPLRDSISDEFFDCWPALEALIPEGGGAEDVRIVFDFDS